MADPDPAPHHAPEPEPVADRPPVALVCAMPMELAPLTRRLGLRHQQLGTEDVRTGAIGDQPVVAVVTGMGTALATAGVERLLAATPVAGVLVVGITGAIHDALPLGALVVPETVVHGASGVQHRPTPIGTLAHAGVLWTTDDLLTDPDVLDGLRNQGVIALDMETAAVAAVCQRAGVAWSVVRAVSDRATDGSVDQEVFAMSRQDGSPDPRAVATYLARHPAKVPGLSRMARAARTATQRAASAAVDAVAAGWGNA